MKLRTLLGAVLPALAVVLALSACHSAAAEGGSGVPGGSQAGASDASAADAPTSTQALFTDYLGADGAYAEDYQVQLMDVFLASPEEFVSTLALFDADDQERIIFALSAEGYMTVPEKRVAFESIVYDAGENQEIFQQIIQDYEKITADFSNPPAKPDRGHIPVYNRETVRMIVDSFLSDGPVENEEFFAYFADVYKKEPEIALSCLAPYSEDRIAPLAKGVAAVYAAEGYCVPSSQADTGDETSFASLVEKYAQDSLQPSVQDQAAAQAAVYTPTITSFVYTEEVVIGKDIPLAITLTETSGVSSARTYTVKVYCTRDGVEYHCATITMRIPAGSTKATANATLRFTRPGPFTTRVAVYNGSTLLITREGRNPDISHNN